MIKKAKTYAKYVAEKYLKSLAVASVLTGILINAAIATGMLFGHAEASSTGKVLQYIVDTIMILGLFFWIGSDKAMALGYAFFKTLTVLTLCSFALPGAWYLMYSIMHNQTKIHLGLFGVCCLLTLVFFLVRAFIITKRFVEAKIRRVMENKQIKDNAPKIWELIKIILGNFKK